METPDPTAAAVQSTPIDIAINGLAAALRAAYEDRDALAVLATSRGDDLATCKLLLSKALTLAHDMTISRDRERERYHSVLDENRRLRGSLQVNGSLRSRAA